MISTLCLTCGIQTTNGSRCVRHTIEQDRTRRPSFMARYGPEYQRNRRALLRSSRVCRKCGHRGSRDNPLSADHIIARVKGGTHALSNLQVLCLNCNRSKRSGGGGA